MDVIKCFFLIPKTERMDLSIMFASRLSIVFGWPITIRKENSIYSNSSTSRKIVMKNGYLISNRYKY